MPELTGTVLQQLHGHARDSRITFTEEGHRYTIDGDSTSFTSVTTLVHRFFPHFDAPKVIERLVVNPKSQYFMMEPEAVQQQWNHATELGSLLHQDIEIFFDQLAGCGDVPQLAAPSVEFGYFLEFFRDHVVGKMKPYRTEWYVFDEDIRVCGSIDMLFADPNDDRKLYIYDWKRAKDIRKSSPFGKGLKCLTHLDHCNFVHYSLQLNMYKYILESKYDKEIIGMALVVLHPNQSTYQIIELQNMGAEIHAILASKDVPEDEKVPAVRGNVSKYL